MCPKRGPKTVQAESGKITKLEGRLMKFLDFSGPRVSLWGPKQGPKRGPKRGLDAEGARKPLGRLLDRSRKLSGSKKSNRERLLGGQEAPTRSIYRNKGVLDLGQHGNGKRIAFQAHDHIEFAHACLSLLYCTAVLLLLPCHHLSSSTKEGGEGGGDRWKSSE